MVLIGANGAPLTAGLTKAEGELKGFGASGTSALAGIRLAALGVGVAAVAGMGVAVGAASDFQEQMAIINTIAGQTGPELAKTGDGIRAMAVASGTPLGDLTSAYYDLVSAGIKPGADALTLLGQANTLGIGGLASTKQTVDLLTSAVNSYGLNAKGGAVATDQFALAIKDGKVTAAEIADTFADVAPLARTAGVGIDEISASYATLTAGGVKAPEAMTQMNRAMVELIKPGHALTALQDKMGVNFADIAKDKGLVVALQKMRDGAEKNHIPFANLFGRLEGLKFALATTGPHFKAYQAELEKMHKAGGTAAEQAAARSQTFDRQVKILGTSFNDLAISVGTGLLPPLTALVKGISGVLNGIKEFAAANPELATNILPVAAGISALVVASLSLGPILGGIGVVVGIIASPIVLIGGAILALAAHFGLLGDGAKNAFDGIVGTVAAAIPGIVSMLQQVAGQIVSQLGRWAAAFVGWIGPMIGPALAMLGQFAGRALAWVSAQVPVLVGQVGKWAAAFVDWIAPMIPPALAALGRLVAAGIAWVAAQLPKWTAALLKWVEAFLAWLAPMIPPLLAELGKFAAALIGWIAQEVPVLGLALLKLGQQLVAWVDNAIPGLVAALARFLNQVLAWFQQIAPTIAKAASDLGGSIANNLIAGIGDIGKAIGDKLNTIPGLSLVGGAVGGAVGAAQSIKLPGFATGGVVPGTGPQLAIVHGGETVTPAGKGGGQTNLTHTTVVQLDGQTIGQVVERLLFNSASGFSSGFAGSSVTD